MRNYFFIFLFTFCRLPTFFCFGQNTQLDSLLSVLKTTKEDSTKIHIYNDLFLEYEFNDEAKAQEFLDKALALSQKINFKKGLTTAYLYSGYFAEDKANYPEALRNYQSSLKTAEAINDKIGIGNAYNNIGIVYKSQGNFAEAVKNYSASLKIRLEIEDKSGIASTYNSIGNVFYAQGNYPEALKKYFLSLKIREKEGDMVEIAKSRNNIGTVYLDQGNYSEALKNYFVFLKIMKLTGNKKGEATAYNNLGIIYTAQGNFSEAITSHLVSLKIGKETNDKKSIASSFNNLGSVYDDLAKLEKDPTLRKSKFDQALKNLFASLKIKEELGDKIGVAGTNGVIGEVYINQKKYKEAREYIIRSKILSEEIGYKKNLKEIYHNLTYLDSAQGDFKEAYKTHKLYVLYSDSLDNEETRKKTIQSQMTYDFEKKEAVADVEHKKELENQELLSEEKSRKQKIVIASVVIGLLLVLVFAGFVFRSLRITRKQKNIIEEQKNIVEIQKLEVEQQKILVEEHQKEIIDSITYARRIQQSLLPTAIYIERNLNRLMKK